MVEVRIEEMFRSDRSRPKDYERAVVVEASTQRRTRKTTLRSERRSALKKAEKELDRADIGVNRPSDSDSAQMDHS